MPDADDRSPEAAPDDDPVLENAPDDDGDSPVEEAARRQFGLRTWDRPALYRETAEAGTDTDLPFWMVLFLSGAIATLGLVLNSTAVVIGAMLVAPLLGPLLVWRQGRRARGRLSADAACAEEGVSRADPRCGAHARGLLG